MANKGKPGVMIYFDILPSLMRMEPTQISALIIAILEYAQNFVIPTFDDNVLDIMWPQIQQRLDADNERYESKCRKATESINARWSKEKETDTNVYERIETNTFDTNYNSTTNSTTTTNSKQNTNKGDCKGDCIPTKSNDKREFYMKLFHSTDKEMIEFVMQWDYYLRKYLIGVSDLDYTIYRSMERIARIYFKYHDEHMICCLIEDAMHKKLSNVDEQIIKSEYGC